MKRRKPLNCPECHDTVVFPKGSDGELVCKNCGLVVSTPPTIPSFTKWAPKWFSNWDEDDSETLRAWLTTLRTISCQLNIPNFPYREEAARMIRTNSNVLFRSQRFGKNKREAVAALVHLVLKEYDKMRPLKEISQKLSLDHRLVTKYAWTMHKMIEFHGASSTKDNLRKSAKDYLRKYGWKLTADAKLMEHAEQMLKTIRKQISGNPISLAAGALYFVCKNRNMKVSKDKIGEAFHISGRTVYSNERRINRLMSEKSIKS
jgi:transcription initiation factor TFIIIB Brf1 subunit/transcription initiation factor TFIIB